MSRNKNKPPRPLGTSPRRGINRNQRNPPAKQQNNSPGYNLLELLQMFGNINLSGQTTFVNDAFSNPAARMGAGTDNLLDGTEYTHERLTYNWNMLTGLYRSHWIVRRIVDVVAEDMIKNWYKIKSQVSPDIIQKIKGLERRTKIRARILEGLKLSRLYGGAAGVIIIEGHEGILDEPLDFDLIMPGSFKGLIILDRWSGITPDMSLVADINDPDFGLPEYYTIRSDTLGSGIKVHHSRIVRFTGRHLPYYERIMEMYWGASEIEHVFEELKKRDNTSWNIALLVFLANLRIYKMDGMEQVGAMNDNALRDLYSSMTMMNSMMNNQGLQIIGTDESFETKQYTFGGLAEIYELFMMDVSGAAEMPVTKLFGRSPAGMNATGESDMQNYYDSIEETQESDLRPVLDKILPIMCMSEFGAVPDDLEYEFNPCRRPTEQERKNLSKNISDSIVSVFSAGIINQKIALSELRQSSEQTGMWSYITDEDIDNADTSFDMGEFPPMPGIFADRRTIADSGDDDVEWITVNGAHIPMKNGVPQNEIGKEIFAGTLTGSVESDIIGAGGDDVNQEFEKEVEEIFEKIISGSNENKKVEIGDIDDKLIQEGKDNNFDLSGYKHNIDVYGVRHTLKNHGNKEKEEKRGQLAITMNDIKKIPDIIYNYDKVEFSGKNKIGRETITFTKKMNDGTTVYIEEIRSGNKELTLNTMRKRK
jgi:hypothetical protein